METPRIDRTDRMAPEAETISFALADFPVRDHVPLLIQPEHAWSEARRAVGESPDALIIRDNMNNK